jgi:ferrous iron transport protein B
MGGDWRTGLGLMTAFAAREVFVSSLAVIFAGSEDAASEEDEGMSQLLGKLREAKNSEGQALFTLSSIVGLIVFFMIALQCLSTFSVSWRESGSLKFALLQLICFNLVAYLLSVGSVQGLRALGLP